MKFFVVLIFCSNTVLSKVFPQGFNQEKRLQMREEELNLAKTIDNESFKDGPWKSILDAAQNCNAQKVEEQIKQGVNVNIRNGNGCSAIITAARSNCYTVVDLLIQNGADVNSKYTHNWTPLHYAAYNGRVDIADILIENGADKNLGEISGLTPLHLAVHRNREQMVNFLINNKNVTKNVKCKRGWTPLFTAAFKGNVQIAILLVQSGMNVDDTDNEKWTPLHVAAYGGYTLIIRLLLKKGTNVNAAEIDGFRALHLAVQESNDGAVETLLKFGAYVDPITNDGRTPMFIAVFKDRSIKHISSYSAISKGSDEIVRLLLESGANSNFKYLEGWSVIHEACEKGNNRIVELLIKNGANVNVQDVDGWTPLHSAVKQGYEEIVELLVKNGALSYKDKNGKLSMDFAVTKGDVKIIELVKTVLSPAQHACKIYLKLPIHRVLGGELAEPEEFPWMAALGYLGGKNNVTFDCGGTIISDKYIMTAAHCTRKSRPPVVVRLGRITLDDEDDVNPSNFPIQEIIRHPNYSFITKRNDIALIRLGERLNFTTEVVPACLQTDLRDESADVKLIVTGWGTTDNLRIRLSNNLMKAQLTSMPLNVCNTTLLEFNKGVSQAALRNGIMAGQYCAYDPQARNDSCLGDSGGPLQYFADNISGIATVVGIVSAGFSCGTALPAIYTRVAFYVDWIESIVWPAV